MKGPCRIMEGFLDRPQTWTWGRTCQKSIELGLVEEDGERIHGRRKVGVRVRATGCLAGLGKVKGQSMKQKHESMFLGESSRG